MNAMSRRVVGLVSTMAIIGSAFAATLWSAPSAGAAPVGPPASGYVLLAADGGVFPFGVPYLGSAASDAARCPEVSVSVDVGPPVKQGSCGSIAVTPDGKGYWILNTVDGRIWRYGDAGDFGDPARTRADGRVDPVLAMPEIVANPVGTGYWVYEVGFNGVGLLQPFGDAPYWGDTTLRAKQLHLAFRGFPAAMASRPDGTGYWESYSDGGVFAFHNAKFYGSMATRHLAAPIVGFASSASGNGYWLVASDGGVFAFGDAKFAGSMAGRGLNAPIVGMVRNPAGPGYWLAASDGGVFAFGGAPFLGSMAHVGLNGLIVGIAATNGAIPG
jgi:hypothetical protein